MTSIPILGTAYLSDASYFLQIINSDYHIILKLLMYNRGLHSSSFLVHRPSLHPETLPAYFHFRVLMLRAISVIPDLCWITSLQIMSDRETPSISRFIARWATRNLWTSRMVSVHMLAPYVLTDRTHWLCKYGNQTEIEDKTTSVVNMQRSVTVLHSLAKITWRLRSS